MYRVRRVLCVEVKQRQILPGLSEANYPQTGSRAHEKKSVLLLRSRGEKAFDCRAFHTKQRGKGVRFLPPPKTQGFSSPPKIAVLLRNISKTAPMRKRARWPTYRLPRPFFFLRSFIRALFFFPFRLTFHFQNTVDILLNNVVFLDLLFQLPIVGIQGFFLLLKCCVLCLQGGKAW